MGNLLNLLVMLAANQSTAWKLDFEIEFEVKSEVIATGAQWTHTLRHEIGNGSWRDERYTEHYRRVVVGIEEEKTHILRCERGEFFETVQHNSKQYGTRKIKEWRYVDEVKNMKMFGRSLSQNLKLIKDARAERKEIAGIRCIKEERESEGERVVLWLPENADEFEKFGYLEKFWYGRSRDKEWFFAESYTVKSIKRG
jgi:hypothetical protein